MLNLNCTKPLKLNKAVKGGRYKGLGEYKTLGENEAVKTNRWENRRGTTGKGKIRLRQEEKLRAVALLAELSKQLLLSGVAAPHCCNWQSSAPGGQPWQWLLQDARKALIDIHLWRGSSAQERMQGTESQQDLAVELHTKGSRQVGGTRHPWELLQQRCTHVDDDQALTSPVIAACPSPAVMLITFFVSSQLQLFEQSPAYCNAALCVHFQYEPSNALDTNPPPPGRVYAETHGRDAGSAPSPFVLPLTHTHRTTLLWVFVVSHGEQEGHTLPSAPSTTASFPPLTCLPSAPGSR
ncbi:hypothetical protein Anapl_15129 [Anas platyrhynchos]|uniref:Uncharacterized protein n=1 Tax=Anas platyrhynchos TaxID=8839 RepID=R0LD52_ANAPL|nr:hypothetical protein Anapl_15129 [Anas platyrhynchos]